MQEEQTAKENLKTCHDVLLSVLVTQDCQHSRIPNMRPLVLAAPCSILALEAKPALGGLPWLACTRVAGDRL